MKVSVIIPTWNRGYIIEKTIKSVLSQTMSDLEILICDDGSTDDTYEKVLAIKDNRVRWVPGNRAGRPAIPRNKGIGEAKGEWLAFLDSDDEWLPEKLEKQLALAEKMETKAVSSNASRLIPSEGIVGEYLSLVKDRITFDDLLKINEIITSSTLIHASLFDVSIGFPESEDLKTIEDYATWLRIATQTDFAYCSEPLLLYRDDAENSIRGEKNTDIYEQKKQVFKDFMIWGESKKIQRTFLKVAENAYETSLIEKKIPLVMGELAESKKQLHQVRQSYSFRMGYLLLHPFSVFHFFNKNNQQMSSDPRVTVLMPVYNGKKYLKESIGSILNQTFEDFELIIVNDGSTDESEAVIMEYHDPRINYVKNEKNLGLIETLNKGLDMAKGAYVARMDQDDISLSMRLEKQFQYMEKNIDVGVCGSWIRLTGKALPITIKNPIEHEDICCHSLFMNPLAHPTVMIRKKILEENNLKYGQFKSAEDFELWHRCSKICKLHNIPEVLLRYRITPGSITHSNKEDLSVTVNRVLAAKLKELSLEINEQDAEINRLLGNKYSFGKISEMQKVRGHLEKLIEANTEKNIYPKEAFLKTLHYYWVISCVRYSGSYLEVVKIYLHEELFKENNLMRTLMVIKIFLLRIFFDFVDIFFWLVSFIRNILESINILKKQLK